MKPSVVAGAGAAVAVVAAGGWFYASGVADSRADQEIRRWLHDAEIADVVRYGDVSYGLFSGQVTIHDLTIGPDGPTGISIGSLKLSDPVKTAESWEGRHWSEAEDVEIDLLGLARTDPSALPDDLPAGLLELGYYRLKGDVRVDWTYDPDDGVAESAYAFEIEDLGKATLSVAISGLDSRIVEFVRGLSNDPDEAFARAMRFMEDGTAETLFQIALADLQAEFEDDGLRDRVEASLRERAADPDEDPLADILDGVADTGEFLTRNGADIRDSVEVLQDFLRNGGRIRIVTQIDRPIPFLRQGGFLGFGPSAAFEDGPAFVRATGAHLDD